MAIRVATEQMGVRTAATHAWQGAVAFVRYSSWYQCDGGAGPASNPATSGVTGRRSQVHCSESSCAYSSIGMTNIPSSELTTFMFVLLNEFACFDPLYASAPASRAHGSVTRGEEP